MRRKMVIGGSLLVGTALLAAGGWTLRRYEQRRHAFTQITPISVMSTSVVTPTPALIPPERLSSFQRGLLSDLERQVRTNIRYQDGYFSGGDPPAGIGVCTDVVIRSFRAAGVDLQRAVADDIRSAPREYHINRPDPNIDHRRCRNLAVFFRRHAVSLPTTGSAADWQPGDVVFWDTWRDGRIDHVGMIANSLDGSGDPSIVHHWPGLPVSQTDGLHRFPIRCHFRWPRAAARSARSKRSA